MKTTIKTNRIQNMIKKSGLVPAGVYKAEGFFKAYDVHMRGESITTTSTKTFRKKEIVRLPHDTYCLFYEKLSLKFNLYLIRAYLNELNKAKKLEFLDFNVFTLNKVIGKDNVEKLYKEIKK